MPKVLVREIQVYSESHGYNVDFYQIHIKLKSVIPHCFGIK